MEVAYLGKNSVRIVARSIKIVIDGEKLTFPGSNDIVIDGPGEYEAKGIMITGVPVGEDTAYVVQADGGSAGFLSNVTETLSPEAQEQLSELDVLFIAATGHELIGKLEPKYVVPMGEGAELKKFLDEMGAAAGDKQTKLKITGRDVPEETTVVVLDPSN